MINLHEINLLQKIKYLEKNRNYIYVILVHKALPATNERKPFYFINFVVDISGSDSIPFYQKKIFFHLLTTRFGFKLKEFNPVHDSYSFYSII